MFSEQPDLSFIAGALVDPRSYAPFAQAIAAQGYLTAIVKMVEDLALKIKLHKSSLKVYGYPAAG